MQLLIPVTLLWFLKIEIIYKNWRFVFTDDVITHNVEFNPFLHRIGNKKLNGIKIFFLNLRFTGKQRKTGNLPFFGDKKKFPGISPADGCHLNNIQKNFILKHLNSFSFPF